ncbi:hypothetical protein FRC10_009440 [Ceratobasidium sp. 414]|nr:hypothetical protein FRC10_009440 [Ceratobasidium sp. 414]
MAPSLAPEYPFPPWDFTDKNSFAYNTVVKRWPVIITNLIDTVYRAMDTESNGDAEKISEGKAVISRLAKLKYDMGHDRPLERIPSDGGPNSDVYNARLEDLERSSKGTWMGIPWLYGECYLYRLFDSVFRATKHWSTFDPFFQQKEDTFRESGAAVHQLAKVMADLDERQAEFKPSADGWEDKLAIVFAEMVQMCLWGNATDLSMLPSMDPADIALLQAVGEDKAHLILRNDAGALWAHVKGLKDTRIDFVLDNAGFELFTDLVFADFLVTYTPFANKAVFHPKPIPWFVSDVTPRDFSSIFGALADQTFFTTLDKSSMQPEALTKMLTRWEDHVKKGVFALSPESTHAFWVAPGGYWEIAPGRDGEEIGKALDGSGLVVFKADVVVGLGPGVAEKLDADPKEKGWRAGGKTIALGLSSTADTALVLLCPLDCMLKLMIMKT